MPDLRQWTLFVTRETGSSISTNEEDNLHQTVVQMLIRISHSSMRVSFFSLEDLDGFASDQQTVGDMPKSPSSQYGLKAQEDIDPRGIRVTNGPLR